MLDDFAPFDLSRGGVRVHGRIGEAWPHGIARVRLGAPNGPSSIRNGLDWLLASAAGIERPFAEIHAREHGDVGPYFREAIDRDIAREALRTLMAIREEGLRRPLPFAPYSAWALHAAPTPVLGMRDAARTWRGGERQWGEGSGDAWQLVLRGRDLFGDEALRDEFARLAGTIYGALATGASEPIDIAGIEVPAADDGEEAA